MGRKGWDESDGERGGSSRQWRLMKEGPLVKERTRRSSGQLQVM